MKRYFIAGTLLFMAVAAIAAPYAAPKVFVPGDPIRSSDFNAINTAISAACGTGAITTEQIADSQVTGGKLATGAAASNLAINSINYNMLNYSDSSTFDSMPVKIFTSRYIGDGNPYQVITLPIYAKRVEITRYITFGNSKNAVLFDLSWGNNETNPTSQTDKTCYVDSGVSSGFVSTVAPVMIYGTARSNLRVFSNGVIDLNAADTYYYTVWGY